MSGGDTANKNKTLIKKKEKMGMRYLMRNTTHKGSYRVIELTLGTESRARYN